MLTLAHVVPILHATTSKIKDQLPHTKLNLNYVHAYRI